MPTFSNSVDSNNQIPWLCSEYIEEVIRSKYNDNTIKIVKFEIMPATAKGENYASVMSRVRLEYVCKSCDKSVKCSYIVKTSLDDDDSSLVYNVIQNYDFYNREMEIYNSILPQLKAILQKIGYNQDIVANTIKIDKKHEAMIFEDLVERGYVTVERKNGLDSVHAKLLLRKVAKFHAASAVLNELKPDTFKSYDRGTFNKYTDCFEPFFAGGIEMCGRIVSDWKGYEYYGEKLLKLAPKVQEYGLKLFEVRNNLLNVFSHGDLWCNNVMFKYNDDKQPIDVILIDFQLSCWGSPALDLHYFFNTSLTEDLRLNSLDELVQFYYKNLTDSLRALKYRGRIPSLLEFWLEYMEKSFYAVTSAFVCQPIQINDKTEDADAASLLEDNEKSRNFKKAVYSNEKVQENLKRLLPVFDRRGLLDVY